MGNDKKITILSIDDEASIRESFAAHLEDDGYHTLIAEDGSVGLEIFQRDHPDLVLVDLRMKEVDGLDVLEKVVKESPETPIIVVSGTGNIRDAIYALRLGAWNYLLKPIEDMSILTHAVESALERARLLNESREHQRHLEEAVAEKTRELRLSNEELQQEIRERKKLQEQLVQAQKMESIGTLAGGIAHDFNNILTSIVGFAYLAKMNSPKGSAGIDFLDRVAEAANRATDLVKQILTFSRMDNQELLPIMVWPTVKEAMKLLRASIPTTIEIRQNIAPTGNVMADPTQVYQIVMNLCTNAYHSMQETGGVLEVDLQEVIIDADFASMHVNLKPGLYASLSIRDTGQGIDPTIIDRIFDPYFTTKEKGKGTGLGLSVVHGIVRRYGGTITVASELTKGTRFIIYLPVVKDEAKPAEKTAESLIRGNETVLVVDDEKSMVIINREMLESLGYKVISCLDSRDALKMFRERHDKIDLVLTDMTMPGMTGLTLAREIVKIRHDIPVILVTGFSEGLNDEVIKKAGVRELLMKPYTPDKLSQIIRNILDESHGGQSPNNSDES